MFKYCPAKACEQRGRPVRDAAQSTCTACGAWLTVELERGDVVLGFEVLVKLPEGDGGMATVYRARHRALRQHVALKVCRDRPYEYSALQREAQALRALQHPHIVKIIRVPAVREQDAYVPKTYMAGEPRCFIALEFVDGASLRRRLANAKHLTWPDVARVTRQVGLALSFAHSKGFLHLDVKPSNVLLAKGGKHAVLTDFGLVLPSDTGRRTGEGQRLLGTAGYMSPEHVARERLDYRSDIFSLGVVVYEMLTGVAPFARKETSDTLKAVLRRDTVPPSRHLPGLPAAADAVVMKALARERGERYQSTKDLVEDLERALGVGHGIFG